MGVRGVWNFPLTSISSVYANCLNCFAVVVVAGRTCVLFLGCWFCVVYARRVLNRWVLRRRTGEGVALWEQRGMDCTRMKSCKTQCGGRAWTNRGSIAWLSWSSRMQERARAWAGVASRFQGRRECSCLDRCDSAHLLISAISLAFPRIRLESQCRNSHQKSPQQIVLSFSSSLELWSMSCGAGGCCCYYYWGTSGSETEREVSMHDGDHSMKVNW